MYDRLADGRAYNLLTIAYVISRQGVALEVVFAFRSEDVVDVLQRACRERAVPKVLRCDNDAELLAKPIDHWMLLELREARILTPWKVVQIKHIANRSTPACEKNYSSELISIHS